MILHNVVFFLGASFTSASLVLPKTGSIRPAKEESNNLRATESPVSGEDDILQDPLLPPIIQRLQKQQQQQQSVTTTVRQMLSQSVSLTQQSTVAPVAQIESPVLQQSSPSPNPQQISAEKLNAILQNIRAILPALANLEKSLSELVESTESAPERQSVPVEIQNTVQPDLPIRLANSTADDILLLLGDPLIVPQGLQQPVAVVPSVKTEEVNIPMPTKAAITDESPEIIHTYVDSMYPRDPLPTVIRSIKSLPSRKSQEIAFERLTEKIAASAKDRPGKQDTIELACELYGKPQYDYIASQHSTFVAIYSNFFEGETKVYFEARTGYDEFKNFYFDRSNLHFGITNRPLPFVFQAWKFSPVADAGCFFMIVSAETEFALGMVVTNSEESPLLARNIIGVGDVDESTLNPRFHWKVIPFTPEGGDRPLLVLKNRETNLVIEWDEFNRVFPNEINYSLNQLWDLGRENL